MERHRQIEKIDVKKNLSIVEYFNVIQAEYFIAEFKRKIYFSPKDKRYYEKVMRFKREKIENISSRYRLLNIFTSAEKAAEVKSPLFDFFGRPTFEMSQKDWDNYYSINSDFSYNGEPWKLDAIKDNTLTLYNERTQMYVDGVSKDEAIRIL